MNLEKTIVKELATKWGYIHMTDFSLHKNKYYNINLKHAVQVGYNGTCHFKGFRQARDLSVLKIRR